MGERGKTALVIDAVAAPEGEAGGPLGGLMRMFMPSAAGAVPSYRVVETRPRNRRAGARAPVRLATGKLFDHRRRFIAECHVCDVSPTGLRIRAPRAARVQDAAGLYEDATGMIRAVAHVWSHNGYSGLRLVRDEMDEPTRRKLRARLSGPYYALD